MIHVNDSIDPKIYADIGMLSKGDLKVARTGLLSLIVLLSGCIYIPPVWYIGDQIYALDFIQRGVTTKGEVIRTLGDPVTSWEVAGTTRILYRGHKSGGAIVGTHGGGEIAPSDWTVEIEFDEDDLVSAVRTSEGGPVPNTPTWKTLAESACDSDFTAQTVVGVHYHLGWDPVAPDPIRAYVWYSIASKNGGQLAKTHRRQLVEEMTSLEVAEAKRILSQWDHKRCREELQQAKSSVVN